MSKLCREELGKTFEVMNSNETINIEYCIIDESFAHEFGTQVQFGYEIMKIEAWIDEISEWVEVGDSEDLDKYAQKIVEYDL
jgi:hypothetical protein